MAYDAEMTRIRKILEETDLSSSEEVGSEEGDLFSIPLQRWRRSRKRGYSCSGLCMLWIKPRIFRRPAPAEKDKIYAWKGKDKKTWWMNVPKSQGRTRSSKLKKTKKANIQKKRTILKWRQWLAKELSFGIKIYPVQ